MADAEENGQDSAAMTSDQQGTTPATDERVAALEAELEQARAEAAANNNKYLLAAADMDNARKAAIRREEDRVRRERSSLLNEMFEVMDNLDRALKVDESADLESLQKGLRMVQFMFAQLLEKEGIKPVATVGEPFDPEYHEAVEHVGGSDQPADRVVEEVRKGYVMDGRTIRPARVKVSKGK
ncbi:MAG TPA: nucleotide exchange factor GrpE [Ktedonobacterales bacterium]|nr:nucleotide exchange factor GrpE [Ktedonobacterales bacterium]